jgi:hypothetical protein
VILMRMSNPSTSASKGLTAPTMERSMAFGSRMFRSFRQYRILSHERPFV